MGRFGTYLYRHISKLNTALSYMTQMKNHFNKQFDKDTQWSLHPTNTNPNWYRDVRRGVTKLYT